MFDGDVARVKDAAKDGTLVDKILFTCVAVNCGCFSGSSSVRTLRGTIPVSDLKLGDFVQTQTPGQAAHFTEFLGWLDRSASGPADLLNISTSSSSIALTASHVIFRATKSGSIESIYAGELHEGDKLVKSSSDTLMEEEEIVSIETKRESSYWAPLTKDGTLLVDGFLASSYASFPHELSQLAFAPVKMFPSLFLDDTNSQHEDGVRKVVKVLKELGNQIGLRRKVLEEKSLLDENYLLPTKRDTAIATIFSKSIEL